MSSYGTVLVTGATGFVGRATAVVLESKGWKVTRGTRSVGQSQAEGFVFIDLADPTTLFSIAKTDRFDCIVHLGAHVGLSGATEAEMFLPNVLSTGCLAYLARLWNAQLIFASTAIIHGVRNEKIESHSPVSADTAYASSKWFGEQMIENSHVHYCILRIAGVFGSGGPTHLALNRAIDAAARGEKPTIVGSGQACRNYIYVKDVAKAIVHALQTNLRGTHLLAGQEILSISDMLGAICDEFLPGTHPANIEGPEAMDQVVQPSPDLPKSRQFREALADIHEELVGA
jgi:nucleoside-diphosphate-sugar epimerase